MPKGFSPASIDIILNLVFPATQTQCKQLVARKTAVSTFQPLVTLEVTE
jgi:hypothetical protein